MGEEKVTRAQLLLGFYEYSPKRLQRIVCLLLPCEDTGGILCLGSERVPATDNRVTASLTMGFSALSLQDHAISFELLYFVTAA